MVDSETGPTLYAGDNGGTLYVYEKPSLYGSAGAQAPSTAKVPTPAATSKVVAAGGGGTYSGAALLSRNKSKVCVSVSVSVSVSISV